MIIYLTLCKYFAKLYKMHNFLEKYIIKNNLGLFTMRHREFLKDLSKAPRLDTVPGEFNYVFKDQTILILYYSIFQTIRSIPPPNVRGKWDCMLQAKCSLPGSLGGGLQWSGVFFSCFPPLKSRYVLWSGASYNPKDMVMLPKQRKMKTLK